MGRMPKPDSTVETTIDRSRMSSPFRPFHLPPAFAGAPALGGPAAPVTHPADGPAYPIPPANARRPALRDETLAPDRLLDWLAAKAHSRVLLLLADAGYGKTTLLADFSRRTRLRTLWYRMDEEDRNWVTFLSYLVAAGREHDPEFAPRTFALLQDTGPGGATRD